MNREREFAVMAVELCKNHHIEDAVYQVIMQYGSELKREIIARIDAESAMDHKKDKHFTECAELVADTTLKPTWPLK